MTEDETYKFLYENNIDYEKTEHKAVYNMTELDSINLPYPEWDAKNLFSRDDKKRNYYLITVKGDRKVDLKKFRREHGFRSISFASSEELYSIMNLHEDSVTHLGILCGQEHRAHFFLDSKFKGSKIGIHPNDNTATIWLSRMI